MTNPMIKATTSETIDAMLAAADEAPRRRTHLNLHESPDDPIQRLFVASKRDAYFPPHRHPRIDETAIMVRGVFDILTFDDDGVVTDRRRCSPDSGLITFEIAANVWHCGVVMSDDAVFFEVKSGPYDPATISDFAPWAPAEGGEGVAVFQTVLRNVEVGDRV